MQTNTCCFSGHRQIPSDQISALQVHLEKTLRLLIDHGYLHFCSGGAKGFDLLAARTVLNLKSEFPSLSLHMILPFRRQAATWTIQEILEYSDIVSQADTVQYVFQAYEPGCYNLRNRALVDNSTCCICYLTNPKSGTGYTVSYAKESGLTILNLAKYFASPT